MKRIISYLLAAVLIFMPYQEAFAAEIGTETTESIEEEAASVQKTTDSMAGDTAKNASVDETSKEGENKGTVDILSEQQEGTENRDDIGQVNVTVRSAVVLKKEVEFAVSLTGQSMKNIVLAADSGKQPSEGSVVFEGLKSGKYTLKVSASGFAEYTQEIEVDGWTYAVQLMTGFVSGYEYDKGNVHPGVLLIGDVDGNGVVNDTDKDTIVDAIDAGKNTGLSDLNGDGVSDIVDLEYFAKGYKASGDIHSSVGISVPGAVINAENDSDTSVKGSLDSVLKDEGSVTLSRKDGAAIDGEHPVTMTFDIAQESGRTIDGIMVRTAGDNPITDAVAEITYVNEADGQEDTVQIPVKEGVDFLLKKEDVKVSQSADGSICIHLGSQISVKKVTFKITGLKKNNNLAEISKVEFVNGMENRIPEPQMDIPQNLKTQTGNKAFTATWDACVNVTGYEVMVSCDGKDEVRTVRGNMLAVSSFNGDKLVNKKEYEVKVQSVNGTWRSGYGQSVKAVPAADKKPDAPDNLKTTGQYCAVTAVWKNMEDTDFYNLYYKKSSESSYKRVDNITANSYTISNLEDETSYDVYVTGVNDIGESGPSLISTAQTTNPDPAEMPKYKLINYAGKGEVSEHIINVTAPKNTMQDSLKDTEEGTAFGTVDNDYKSHYLLNTWDSGGFNALSASGGITYEFDKEYKLNKIALQEVSPQSPEYFYAKVRCWNGQGQVSELGNVSIQKKTDKKNRAYYLITLPKPVTAKKLQFGLARYVASGTITVSEVYFYHYDSLEDDIMALYTDDLHIELKSDVTQETIDALRQRINTKDEVSGEYHPDKEKLEKALAEAEDLLKANPMEIVRIHNSITTNDVGRGFGGLNAWQPLGVSAAAGEELTVYVGHNKKNTGDSTNLQLVSTQYHSEAAGVFKVVQTLKIGKNNVVIPQLSSTKTEAGGALYIQYTGSNPEDEYAVRVSGGAQVPVLDLYKVTDSAGKLQKAKEYLTKLEEHTGKIAEEHEKLHKSSENSLVKYDYEEKNCILGATDILLDTMMLSLPAKQVYAGTGSGDLDAKARKLVDSMDAVEKMMHLFYQHKGLNNGAEDQKDRFPAQHLNIRYQRMFAGAFMYASGNHIGIEWNETAGMMGGVPVQSDDEGRYISGRYFGWGIAHEIGHCINQGNYAEAEITNNYFAVLAQAKDRNDSVRFSYDNVYRKVTSNTKGKAENVFTQLGMYWQLHLAYDNGYNYKTYENHGTQLENLFFARVDSYARIPSRAPKGLALSGNKDQDLMRLSCAAAEKNILDFFERWGMTPNDETKAYAAQFEKEMRAICYVSDDARVYRLENGQGSLKSDGTTEAVGDGTAAAVDENIRNQVNFTLTSKNIPEDDVLGYEIVRYTTSGGETEGEVVGFVTKETVESDGFCDHVTTMNNRVVTYGITVVDKFLNRSQEKILDSLKIEHKGNIDKSNWTVSAEDIKASGSRSESEADEGDPCAPKTEDPLKKAFDNDSSTSYTGTAGAGAQIIFEFNRTHTVTGLEYTANEGNLIKDYTVYIRNKDGEWEKAANGTFNKEKIQTVYFENADGKNIAAYNTTAVKLAIENQNGSEVTISELDVLGVTGDNVDFRRSGEGTAAIGRLGNAYRYGDKQDQVIPKDSVVFTGSYKGNPAYNTVILYDQDGNIVGGLDEESSLKAQQIILADVPDTGNVQDVSDGTWIYWIEPKDNIDLKALKKVRAELYRVNNAETNEGQRLVSDSLFETMPDELPEITFSGNNN